MSEEKKRRPLRVLFRLLVFVGLAAVASKLVGAKKAEMQGLTESEARAKFEQKLAARIGDEAASDIADKVISKLKARGVIKDDPVASPTEGSADDGDEEMADAKEEAHAD